MKLIPLSQGKFAQVDDEDFEWLNQWKWSYSHGYAIRFGTPHMMHRLINNTPEDMYTDHINGDGLDNRRKNLRSCTNAENAWNQKKHKDNASGFKGVRWHPGNKAWQARISVLGKEKSIGYFKTPELAAEAYDRSARELFSSFARTNSDE